MWMGDDHSSQTALHHTAPHQLDGVAKLEQTNQTLTEFLHTIHRCDTLMRW